MHAAISSSVTIGVLCVGFSSFRGITGEGYAAQLVTRSDPWVGCGPMAQNDMLKRYLDAGIAFTNMSRTRAEGIVNDLVKAGEINRDQAQARAEELVERSRRNTEALVDRVRKELSEQLSSMGL